MKTISIIFFCGEPVKERDHNILQLLGGLGPDYNSIVASLTASKMTSLHSVHVFFLPMSKDYISNIRLLRSFFCLCPYGFYSIQTTKQTSSTSSLSSSVKTSAPSLIFF
ncbi:hypothetical protein AAG906_025719 [Vitis piasezkii]